MAVELGTRVVRGPDWKWDDQDGGEGHVGTVVFIGKGDIADRPEKTVLVMWDMGRKNNYRAGFKRSYDLRIFDNAQTDVVHPDVSCMICKGEGIHGIRWKCFNCFECNLCTLCFMFGKHDIGHQFQRFITKDSAGRALYRRQGARKVEALGTFPGALVQRGIDWKYGDQDGGESSRPGNMIDIQGWGNKGNRAAAGVKWRGKTNEPKIYRYRLGIEGKVDIKCKEEGRGGTYYPDLLPNLGETEELQVGDTVVIQLGKDTLKSLDIAKISVARETQEVAGEKGVVKEVTNKGELSIHFLSGQNVQINPIAVRKVSAFSVGDRVRLITDQSQAENLQRGHGGWNHSMRKILGREAIVEQIYSDGDVKVKIEDTSIRLLFHPACLIFVESDDTDNNEGNGGQLTSSKLDSGSDQDDISFGGLSAPPEILARGPRAQRAYAEAAKAGTKKVYRTRLMLVGQERVGKTSLKKTLTGQGFDKNEAITDGVETANTCEISIEDAKTGEKMWSIPQKGHGNEDKKDDEYSIALADEIAKRLKMTPPQDQESLEPHSETTLSRGLNPEETENKYKKTLAEEIPKRLTVTPPQDQESLEPHSDTTLDTKESVLNNVKSPKAKEDDNNMPHQIASLVEKTLKEQVHLKEIGTDSTDSGRGEGVTLSIWDFAGHDVYYTTHQVFLTWRAIYVIVFDLSRSLDSVVPPESRDERYETAKGGAKSELTCLEFINFWLCSIFAHAVAPSSKTPQKSPPIFIVGTHRESVKGDAKEKKKKIDSAFKKIRNSIKKKPFERHVVRKYYAIENSFEDKDKELILLKRHIEEVAMEEPYMGEEIPLRWLLFENFLATVDSKYMSLDQIKVLVQPIGINSERELLTMLTFYHDLGYVVYYGGIEDQQSLLRDMVILNPQWLIDVFKQVITILDPAEMFQNRSFNDAWTTLEDDGILEDRLIQHMWHNLDQKEALVQLMAKFDLICEAPVERLKQEQQDGKDAKVSNETEKVVKKRYYVPSRLKSHCSPEEIARTKSTDFYVDFKGFLPDGLFHRLMARAVRWMGERDGEPVNLFYRQIRLMVDEEHHAFLEMLPPPEANIKVTVFRGLDPVSDDDRPPEPSAVKKVMDFVTSTLVSLKQHWAKGIKYDVCILCPCSSLRCREKKLFEDCLKRKSLTCGIYNISTADIKSKFGMSEEGVESGNKIPVMPKGSTCKESIVLCDCYFSDLAQLIGSEWHQLGIRLGLIQADIDHITEDNLTAVDRRVAMLQLWKKRSSCTDKGMVEKLCIALISCGRRDLAKKVKIDAGIS